MASSSELRVWWQGYLCDTDDYVVVGIPGENGLVWPMLVAGPAAPGFRALAQVMLAHNYLFRERDGGTYNCRHVNDDPSEEWSLHAYAIAIDINPSQNGFGSCDTDMPAAFVDDVLALRTNNGQPVFSWGGNWEPCSVADPMHFQIDCKPSDLNTGIQNGDDDDMPSIEDMREELDRRTDGKAGPANKFYGIGGAVVSALIGKTGRTLGQMVQNTDNQLVQVQKDLDAIKAKLGI